MEMLKRIKGKKLILRKIKRTDASFLTKKINNKKIYQNTLRIPYPYTLKDAKSWIEKNIREEKKENPKTVNFIIEVNGDFAGSISFTGIEKQHKAELGYWLAEDYWGQGIMTEAISLVEEVAFKKLKLKRVTAHVFEFNKGSARVLEKNGYQLEGTMKKDVKKDGKFIDAFLYSKVK